jgi:thioredoxin reductase (NADPH)
VHSDLARGLGTSVTEGGSLIVDRHQCTSVPGLFAAGDVVDSVNQISVAMGQAAVAATAVHNLCRGCPAT